MAEFRYLTATEWGMDWKRPPVPEVLSDPEVYVHHTAGTVPYSDAARYLRWLNDVAQDSKDYSALDYDIMVHRNWITGVTTIAEGRGRYLSAATRDRNEQGEAICVAGYFHPGKSYSRPPHPDEVEAVARGIVWGIEKGWIAKTAKILGHRDNPAHPGATACPGDYLYVLLPKIRARVAAILNPPEVHDVNWKPTDATVAAVNDAPPTDMVLAGAANDWAVIALIKAYQEKAGLPVTGRWDQALGLSVDKTLEPAS